MNSNVMLHLNASRLTPPHPRNPLKQRSGKSDFKPLHAIAKCVNAAFCKMEISSKCIFGLRDALKGDDRH